MLKPLSVWITTNCGKFLMRWEYQTTLPTSWETCMQVKKQQLKPDMEKQTGSKLGKEHVKAVYCLIPCLFDLYAELLLFSPSVVSDSLWPHGLQHARLPCHSPSPQACSNSCPLSHWCHPTISSSVVPFTSCPQSFPASGSFPMSRLFALGGQSIRASLIISLSNEYLGLISFRMTGFISLQSKGLSRVFSNTTVLESIKSSLLSNSPIQTWLLEKP